MAHAEATWFGPARRGAPGAWSGLTYIGSVAGFIAARFALGLGEAGNFPAAIKVVAEWFPKQERAFATGIFNSGTNVGALMTPLVVPWITLTWGWYWAFIATGLHRVSLAGRLVAALWPSGVTPAAGAARSSRTSAAIRRIRRSTMPWGTLLQHRQTWAFALGKFMTDPVWWLYLFWIPDFLNRNHGIDLPDDRTAARRDLPDRRRRQHRRRLAVVYAHQARVDGERRSQDGDARLRAGRAADAVRLEAPPTSGSRSRWSASRPRRTRAGRRTSSRSRPTCSRGRLSAPSSGFGGIAGAVGGMLIAKLTGYILRRDGQLRAGLPDRGVRLSGRAGRHPPAGAEWSR